jgi:arginine decarboxylase-like protein
MSQWWIGKSLDVDYNGVNVKSFTENGPSLNYTWPPKTNDVFILISDVLAKINPPKPRTRSGRSLFGITSDENNLISKEFELYVTNLHLNINFLSLSSVTRNKREWARNPLDWILFSSTPMS